MQVSLKLFGALRQYLPAGSSYNSCALDVDADAKLAEILQRLHIPAQKSYLVIINDEKVHAEDYASVKVHPDDDIVLLPPIKGG